MKKKLLCLLLALILGLASVGCGMGKKEQTPSGGVEILPEVSPMPTPDLKDGEVKDGDGVIGNGENGTVQPSPSASPVPSASPRPTVAPSASPKP